MRRVYEENGVQSRMKQDVMVSVIVPTYNHERYIRQALDSIFLQEIPWNIEVLIGDDCSTDNTIEIVREYAKKYPQIIRVFENAYNLGASKNCYNLLINAKGKYLATLEGDDYWSDPYKLKIQIDFLESHSEYIGCAHKFIVVDENSCPLTNQCISWVKEKKIFTLSDYDGLAMPGQPSTFVRRNIFLDSNVDYSICYKINRMILDRTLMLFFLAQGNFYHIDRVMGCYRKVIRKGNCNITSMEYVTKHSALDDYQMTLALEQIAEEMFNQKINCQRTKHLLFAKAITNCIRFPGKMSAIELITILQRMHNPIVEIIKSPYYIFLLLRYHIMYRRIQ